MFANYADQRLYVAGPDVTDGKQEPRPITPDLVPAAHRGLDPAGLRYADFTLSPNGREIWCVQEQHSRGKVTRAIVAVPLDGSAAERPGGDPAAGDRHRLLRVPDPVTRRQAPGLDLAGITRTCPGTAPSSGSPRSRQGGQAGQETVGRGRLVKGGLRESVLAPAWRDNTSLYVVTDWTGWWNIYQVGLTGEPPQALYPAEEEFAGPLWQLGGRPFAVLGDGRLAVVHGRGSMRLGVLDPDTSELTDLDLPMSEFAPVLSADGTRRGPGGRPETAAVGRPGRRGNAPPRGAARRA